MFESSVAEVAVSRQQTVLTTCCWSNQDILEFLGVKGDLESAIAKLRIGTWRNEFSMLIITNALCNISSNKNIPWSPFKKCLSNRGPLKKRKAYLEGRISNLSFFSQSRDIDWAGGLSQQIVRYNRSRICAYNFQPNNPFYLRWYSLFHRHASSEQGQGHGQGQDVWCCNIKNTRTTRCKDFRDVFSRAKQSNARWR